MVKDLIYIQAKVADPIRLNRIYAWDKNSPGTARV